MKLEYVQTKSHVANIFWGIGNGLAISHFPNKEVFLGNNLGDTYWLCKGDTTTLAVKDMNGILKLTKKMEKELLKKPNHIQKIRKTFDKKSKSVLKTIKALKEKDFSRVSNKKLLDLYKKILRDYHEVYHYGEPIAFAARNFAERTQPKFKGTDDEFNHVITPVEKSFLQKERLSLLRIFLSKKEVNNKLRLHTKKFEWVPYDYGVTYFTKEDFKKEFEKLKKKPIKDIKQKYNFLFNYS
ncbi:MAG: hypothetical protein KKF65_06045, partial [Nanoarchaeota archaeon]|nr:hypothetical protein [Nanoarchaeota archaeon]